MNAGISLEGVGLAMDGTILGAPVGVIAGAVGAVAIGISMLSAYSGKNAVRPAPTAVSNPEKFGLNISPGGPEDMIPNLKPNLPKWAKAAVGALVGGSLVAEKYMEYKEQSDSIQDFKNKSEPNTGQQITQGGNTSSKNISNTKSNTGNNKQTK